MFAKCSKNPGHMQFILAAEFTTLHLPKHLQDHDLYNYIKSEAGLTIKLEVNKVNTERPPFYPNRDTPYLWYKLHFGSGEVYNVIKFQNGVGSDVRRREFKRGYTACRCEICLESKSAPSWWEVLVRTATHEVFDDQEAKYTECILFHEMDTPHQDSTYVLRNFSGGSHVHSGAQGIKNVSGTGLKK